VIIGIAYAIGLAFVMGVRCGEGQPSGVSRRETLAILIASPLVVLVATLAFVVERPRL